MGKKSGIMQIRLLYPHVLINSYVNESHNQIFGVADLTGIVVIVGTADILAMEIVVGVMGIAGIVGIVVILQA